MLPVVGACGDSTLVMTHRGFECECIVLRACSVNIVYESHPGSKGTLCVRVFVHVRMCVYACTRVCDMVGVHRCVRCNVYGNS